MKLHIFPRSSVGLVRKCWECMIQCKSLSDHTFGQARPLMNDTSSVKRLTVNNLEPFLQAYDTFMLDCDGTLYGTDHVTEIPNVPEAISKLRNIGKHLLFVTNNSMHSNERYVSKFKEVGFDADESDVFGVANASALYLRDIAKVDGKVYVIGGQGVKQELDKHQLENFGAGPDPDQASWDPKKTTSNGI